MEHPLGIVSDFVKSQINGGSLRDILASSPKDFVNCGNLNYAATSTSPFTLTNIGLQISLPLVPVILPNDPLGDSA
jgi:hypothetical protein